MVFAASHDQRPGQKKLCDARNTTVLALELDFICTGVGSIPNVILCILFLADNIPNLWALFTDTNKGGMLGRPLVYDTFTFHSFPCLVVG
jgi:hypothetical protein